MPDASNKISIRMHWSSMPISSPINWWTWEHCHTFTKVLKLMRLFQFYHKKWMKCFGQWHMHLLRRLHTWALAALSPRILWRMKLNGLWRTGTSQHFMCMPHISAKWCRWATKTLSKMWKKIPQVVCHRLIPTLRCDKPAVLTFGLWHGEHQQVLQMSLIASNVINWKSWGSMPWADSNPWTQQTSCSSCPHFWPMALLHHQPEIEGPPPNSSVPSLGHISLISQAAFGHFIRNGNERNLATWLNLGISNCSLLWPL